MKRPYGQDTPRDQLAAQIGAIEGTMLNVMDKDADPIRAAEQVMLLLDAMKGLLPHIHNTPWNPTLPREWESEWEPEW